MNDNNEPVKERPAAFSGRELDVFVEGEVVRPIGSLDAGSHDVLDAAISAALADSATTQLVVDTEGLKFVDSSGLRSLVNAHRSSTEKEKPLVIRNPQAQLTRLFEITGLNDMFTIEQLKQTDPDS